jgi:subtilisin-like proprotein convertase family protein
VPFAAYAVKAGGLACTGCVKLSSIKVDGDLNLGGNALKASTVVAQKIQAGALTSQTVQAGTIQAQKFVGDGSGLTGVGITAGACPKGKVVSGIDQAGKLICVSTAGALPPDGLKNVSNGVMSNNFTDSIVSSKVPIPIPDNNPVGVADTIDVPDLGTAEDLTVSVDVTNSKLDALEITIYDPNNDKYVLWNKGKAGGKVAATYPKPTPTLSGDLTKWVGKNPKGKWRIHVIDHAFKDNKADGAINKWSVNLHTLSNNKVLVKGDLVLTGKIISGGQPGGGSEVKLGSNNGPCNAASLGVLRFHTGQLQYCTGSAWQKVGSKGATYRYAVWSTHSQANGWYAGNKTQFFLGVNPSNWGDGNAKAAQISSNTDILRTMFTMRGPAIGTLKNVVVWAEEWRSYSSTNSRHAAVLFRIRNTTKASIKWTAYWYRTAYGGWSERASIALNGSQIWESGGSTYSPNHTSSHSLTFPANRVSTAIFVASSSQPSGDMRSLFLTFYNNCMALPKGLEFVDDLDTKPNGWTN